MVGWERITKSKSHGGLGIKKLDIQNAALLCKWWWRFGQDKEALWVKVLTGKYGYQSSDWLPSKVSAQNSNISKVWREICNLGEGTSDFSEIINSGFNIKVQSGNNTLFWKDIWLGDQSLEAAFPRLFSVSNQKNAKIEEVFNYADQSWGLIFRRRLFLWEEGQLEVLKQMLNGTHLNPYGVDLLRWKWEPNSGMFTVKSFYEKWDNSFNDLNHIGPHCKLIWKNLSL